ncbi:hypothetical protein OTERR_04050 [Oryzomicrobium terrae]|uniref:Dynamin N-terminal domain-containing protein n=1 Tax=Oryzomicrobium terrae TaxID=1735038 RepID=A0A5C1E4P1_9RHOO|nr:dynamin family protein [Oryzomicrobium terrae]QEL63881.1 hypothetical protein OTERR_04050 [Oryzomicrobium terrae]
MTIAQDFAAYGQWRAGLREGIERFRNWLADNELNDGQTELKLEHLLERLKEDRLNVAFVAEFSRGKSELINAIFFADYGNRMLPSSAGRTTMCPTELLFDPAKAPAIELLPIATREGNTGIAELKRYPDEWHRVPLDTTSAEAMQAALKQVSEVIRVTPEKAAALGFPLGEESHGAYRIGDDGLVEIPRWRHALINFPHPLLQQGLVILDTPGLNAIGAEPELTLSLLPNAHAVLFILSADTGVTQSDLEIWQEHIIGQGAAGSPRAPGRGRLVVLNKIDGLWDELKSDAEVAGEIARQQHSCAAILGVPDGQVFPVSAQKGLVAKINGDAALLARSQLADLERALAGELIPAKREIVRDGAAGELNELHQRIQRLLDARQSGLTEQLTELTELRGKNRGVVEYMMGKIQAEKEEFETGLQRYYAVRSVFSTLTNNLFGHLGMEALKTLTQATRESMVEASFSRHLSEAMTRFFVVVRGNLGKSSGEVSEIAAMMGSVYKQFSVEHGLKLGSPTVFSLQRYEKEILRLERWCNDNLNTPRQLLTHEKRNVIAKFFEEVATQVRRAFEHANRDAELWLKAVMAPMETQVREHQITLKRRLESIKRIHQATETLEDRIAELTHVDGELKTQLHALAQLKASLDARLDAAPPVEVARARAA